MGREIVRQLVAEGCSVAMCDVADAPMQETIAACRADGVPQGVRTTAHVADVADEASMIRFRDEAAKAQDTDRLNLLFNNAGVGGGGSIVTDGRGDWERTFNICWGGVYNGVRTFMPMLLAADEAHIVNTSSLNGFWASVGPLVPHTAYSAAKFAVKGFTEALITDLRLNAPHVKCSVVMPGHIGTAINFNSRKVIRQTDEDVLTADDIARTRKRLARLGAEAAGFSDDDVRAFILEQARKFRDEAPTSAADAATIILDGVKAERWRILVGDDAVKLDALVRADPENAYELDFFDRFTKETGWMVSSAARQVEPAA
jgi:NAD(P)-dependent dehydrogenase (short-subunit alcohol dehydrogenase family)